LVGVFFLLWHEVLFDNKALLTPLPVGGGDETAVVVARFVPCMVIAPLVFPLKLDSSLASVGFLVIVGLCPLLALLTTFAHFAVFAVVTEIALVFVVFWLSMLAIFPTEDNFSMALPNCDISSEKL